MKRSKLECTGNCFNAAFYNDLIIHAMKCDNNTKSEANIVEDEMQKIFQSKKNHEHCNLCYENSTRSLWSAYQILKKL